MIIIKNIKLSIILSVALLLAVNTNAQSSFKAIRKDFNKLSGIWQGTLTYLDYSSGKPYTMPANIEVNRIKKTNQFVFSNIYPNEMSANSRDTRTISTDGKYLDKELIRSRRKLPNGDIEIITEEPGKDGNDNKPAIFRHTYTIGLTSYTNRKDVKFEGETAWINRHEYSYKKKLKS